MSLNSSSTGRSEAWLVGDGRRSETDEVAGKWLSASCKCRKLKSELDISVIISGGS